MMWKAEVRWDNDYPIIGSIQNSEAKANEAADIYRKRWPSVKVVVEQVE